MVWKILLGYLVYVIIGAVLIFALPKKVSEEYADKSNYKKYYSDEESVDRAIILDNPLESGLSRLYIIENAKKSLMPGFYFALKSTRFQIYFTILHKQRLLLPL